MDGPRHPVTKRSGPSWSLAVIVRDEESSIGSVLDEAAMFCDELVVVDTGSVDATVEMAKERGATVHHFEWIDDFSAARNYAFDQCHGDWIVWLDADDRVPHVAQAGFLSLKQELARRSDVDGVMVPYRIQFASHDPTQCTFSFDRERVIRRSAGLEWEGPVHEAIALPYGRILHWPDAWVEHRPDPEGRRGHSDRNLRILERAVAGGDRSPRTLFYLANELRDHARFAEALDVYEDYVGVSQLDWEKYSALLHMAACAAALDDEARELRLLSEAVAFDSRRAEAFNRLGIHFYERKQWRRAEPFFLAATALERPADGFVSDADYSWVPWDYLAICASETGRVEEALEHTTRALAAAAPDRDRLMKNISFYVDRLRST